MNETETFQHYQVLKRDDGSLWELGRGAMGVTYKAFDVNLRCEVALKVISSQYLDSETARARFLREARAAAGLRHRNVASVYHLGNDSESFFYSMEYIDGDTVESLVTTQGPLPCAQALGIVLQVARALGAAAKQGLVHRDIKPANIMVVRDEEDDAMEVKVIDFGLARLAVSGEQSGSITMGGFVGTPQYASPEQIEEKDLDVRSDIYSLGITLWYMLAGQPPFTGSVFRISSQHLTAEPPLEQLAATVPSAVRDLLAHMLQKDPEDRPQTPAKLRAEVESCLGVLSGGSALSSPAGVRRAPSAAATVVGTEAAEVDAGAVTVVQGPAPKAGTIFSGRYQLAELVGEGQNGKVFRAFDGRLDGRQVAVKVLHPHVRLSPQEFYHLQSDLGRLRDAPHPRLIDTYSLERIHGYKFAVMEWVNGFSLTRLLRAGGPLPLRDALLLLGQAVDAAGHCSSHRLHRLELGTHQVFTHFLDAVRDETTPDLDAILARPISEWPTFTLKVDALAPAREASRAANAGGARVPGRDTLTSIRGLIEGSYFRALGLLFHELVGGTDPVLDDATQPEPLAELSDDANAVLQQAISTNPGFATERELIFALIDASGLLAEDVGLTRTVADQPSFRSGASAVRSSTPPTSVPPPSPVGRQLEESPATSSGAVTQARPALPTKPANDSDATRVDRALAEEPPTRVPQERPPATATPPADRAPAPPRPVAVESEAPTLTPPVTSRVVAPTTTPELAPTMVPAPTVARTPEPEIEAEPPEVLAPVAEPTVESFVAPEPVFVEPPEARELAPSEATEHLPSIEDGNASPLAEEPPIDSVLAESVLEMAPTLEAEIEPEPEPIFVPRSDTALVVETKTEHAPVFPVVDEPVFQPVPVEVVVPDVAPEPEASLPTKPIVTRAEFVQEAAPVRAEIEALTEPKWPLAPVVEPTMVVESPVPIFEARSVPNAPVITRPALPPDDAPTIFPESRVRVPSEPAAAATIFPVAPDERRKSLVPPPETHEQRHIEKIPVVEEIPVAKQAVPVPPPAPPSVEIPDETADEEFSPVQDRVPASAETATPRRKLPLVPLAVGAVALVIVGSAVMMLGRKSSTQVARVPNTENTAQTPMASPEIKVPVVVPPEQKNPIPPPVSTPVAATTPAVENQTPPPTPSHLPTATPLPPEPSPAPETPASTPAPPTPTPVPTVASTPPPPAVTNDHKNSTPLPRPAVSSPAPTAKPTAAPSHDPRHLPTPTPAKPAPTPKAKLPVNKPVPPPKGKPTPPPSDDAPGFMR